MLTIRADQMRALGEVALRRFKHRAADYLERRFPAHCQRLGRDAVLESVGVAITRAETYGLVSEVEIVQYLNLMYRLGFEFESDAAWQWIRDILADPALASWEKLMRIQTGRADV